MNKLNTKLAQVDQKLEKQLGNQNQTLTDKLSAFSSIIDRLEKRLEKQLEGVNQTLQNIKPKFYGIVFYYFCFVLFYYNIALRPKTTFLRLLTQVN